MADLYLTPAERYTAALGGFYYGDLPEPGTVYTQLIKDILNGATPDKEPKNILARFIYSLYISDLGDPYPRYELAKLLYWKLHDMTPTKSGSILTVTIDGEEDYMTINTDLSRLWYKVLFGSKTDVITEFPYSFNTMQNKLSDWELFGNVKVSGAPTPDSPIMPQGTGERTANLWGVPIVQGAVADNGNLIDLSTRVRGEYVPILPETQYTIDCNKAIRTIYAYSGHTKVSLIYSNSFQTKTLTFTTPAGCDCICVGFMNDPNSIDISPSDIEYVMLNTGSTALPYEPFGVKIQISSANTTTPVYLGEVETTRKIKKLVLTGEEYVYTYTNADIAFRVNTSDMVANLRTQGYCSHFSVQYTPGYSTVDGITFGAGDKNLYFTFSAETAVALGIVAEDTTSFKTWLAAQYSAGTPVTVWYALANEETAVVNEPLMKIGEYADSLSRTQTGIDIPTVIGQNTLDVLTTVKPSSMRIEYTSADETRSRSKRISLLKSPLKKGLIK